MNAIEAKKATKENLAGRLPEEQFNWVKASIQDRINNGCYKLWIDGILYDSVKERLRNEGYKVSNNFFKDLGGTTITWYE